MNCDAAEQAFAKGQLVIPFFGHHAQDAYGLSGDFGADPVTGQHEDVEIQSVFRLLKAQAEGLLYQGSDLFLALAGHGYNLFVHQALFVVGQRSDLVVDEVQFLRAQSEDPDLRSAFSARGGRCACPERGGPRARRPTSDR